MQVQLSSEICALDHQHNRTPALKNTAFQLRQAHEQHLDKNSADWSSRDDLSIHVGFYWSGDWAVVPALKAIIIKIPLVICDHFPSYWWSLWTGTTLLEFSYIPRHLNGILSRGRETSVSIWVMHIIVSCHRLIFQNHEFDCIFCTVFLHTSHCLTWISVTLDRNIMYPLYRILC